MSRVFIYIVDLTPRQLLVRLWGLLLVGFLLSNFRYLSGLASCVGIFVIVGYSYAVILGMPGSLGNSKRVAKLLLIFLSAVAAIIAIALPFVGFDENGNMVHSQHTNVAFVVLAIAIDVAVFLPFFIATHVIDVTRQVNGTYKPLDFIPTFLGLYFGLFGGFIYTHRLVREVTANANVGQGSKV